LSEGSSYVMPGDKVAARDVGGWWLPKIALTSIEHRDFPVVQVARPDGLGDPLGVPWPASDVVVVRDGSCAHLKGSRR
jgi:hypothetical protein